MAGASNSVALAYDCAGDDVLCADTAQYTVQKLPTSQSGKPSSAQPEDEATPIVALISPTVTPAPTATPLLPSPSPLAKNNGGQADGQNGTTITATNIISKAMALNALATVTNRLTLSATAVITNTVAVTSQADALSLDEAEPQLEAVEQVASPAPTEEIKPLLDVASETMPETEVAFACPVSSSAHFDLLPIEGAALRDHPDAVHGDLNLVLRGYIPADAPLERVDYKGDTDADAPRLHGLFEPNRQAQITAAYRINDWIWDSGQCGGHPRGCPGPPTENFWPVTMVGLATTPGEAIYIPERGPQIYSGGFVAMVLYAEEKRLTLGYTRRDIVSGGYVVHLENLCVDPNLIALYQAQMDGAGWHASGHLPGIRNNQPVGMALEHELKVAIRDAGTFMDPRSTKDWWR